MSPTHKKLLAELTCWAGGNYYFAPSPKITTLREWHITDDLVELWAKLRGYVIEYEFRLAWENGKWSGRADCPPLFLLMDFLDELPTPTEGQLISARRDLVGAIGMRAKCFRQSKTTRSAR